MRAGPRYRSRSANRNKLHSDPTNRVRSFTKISSSLLRCEQTGCSRSSICNRVFCFVYRRFVGSCVICSSAKQGSRKLCIYNQERTFFQLLAIVVEDRSTIHGWSRSAAPFLIGRMPPSLSPEDSHSSFSFLATKSLLCQFPTMKYRKIVANLFHVMTAHW